MKFLWHTVEAELFGLRLDCMYAALNQQSKSTAYAEMVFIDRLEHLAISDKLEKQTRTRQRPFRQAKFKHKSADPADIQFGGERALDKSQIAELLTCDWIENTDNLVISGAIGTGKIWLACCFGVAAVNQGVLVKYFRTNPLVEEMRLSRDDGSITKLCASLVRVSLLILDDFGIAPVSEDAKEDPLELLDGRRDNGSTLIAGQFDPSEWHN